MKFNTIVVSAALFLSSFSFATNHFRNLDNPNVFGWTKARATEELELARKLEAQLEELRAEKAKLAAANSALKSELRKAKEENTLLRADLVTAHGEDIFALSMSEEPLAKGDCIFYVHKSKDLENCRDGVVVKSLGSEAAQVHFNYWRIDNTGTYNWDEKEDEVVPSSQLMKSHQSIGKFKLGSQVLYKTKTLATIEGLYDSANILIKEVNLSGETDRHQIQTIKHLVNITDITLVP